VTFVSSLEDKKNPRQGGVKTLLSVCNPLWHESESLNLSDSPIWAE